jgi:hypothetical protein
MWGLVGCLGLGWVVGVGASGFPLIEGCQFLSTFSG